MTDINSQCFTVGHSSHSFEKFASLLEKHNINVLVDVRSYPHSQYVPQFNKEILTKDLAERGIRYVFLGQGLGARFTDPNLQFTDKGVPDFRLIRSLAVFKRDMAELLSIIKNGSKASLVCAEKDPFDCHRFVLVSYALKKENIEVKHILEDGSLISNVILEDRLIDKYKINYQQSDFFSNQITKSDAIEEGYVLRNKDIGYAKENSKSPQGELL